MSLESFFHEVIAPRRPWYLWPVYGVLRLVSVFYAFGQRVRARLYRKGAFKTRRLDCRVISIGNLTLGGTGKTPTVMQVADLLRRNGFKPAILSRGYGGRSKEPVNVVCDGREVLLTPEAAGDEPVMMARRLKTVPVLTGRDRYTTGKYALEQFGVDVLILDDGYQHLPLHRDLNILLCDGARPFGNGQVFPAGELREPLSALKRADLICITRSRAGGVTEEVERGNLHKVPLVRSGYRAVAAIDLKTGEAAEMESVQAKPAAAFCGIAHPRDFFQMLEEAQVPVVHRENFPDHHDYSAADLQALESDARKAGAEVLLTTEKDAVKIQERQAALPIYAVRIELDILDGRDEWERRVLGQA